LARNKKIENIVEELNTKFIA